jgi:hypothetical protein
MMAHAIEILVLTTTNDPTSACAIGTRSCRARDARGHSVPRRGLQLRRDRRHDGLQFAADCPVEALRRDKGLAELAARQRGSKPTVQTPALEARTMTWTRRPPSQGAARWPRGRSAARWASKDAITARGWRHVGL